MALTIVPIAVLLVIYFALALVAWRRPLLGRLAVREVTRRRGQSALLIIGMMFGTAAILGMQSVSDSFSRIATQGIERAWGRVDITVTQNGQPFSAEVARSLAADPRVASGAAGVQGGFDLVGSAADLDRQLSESPTELVGFDPAQPGIYSFELKDGTTTDGRSLGAGDAVLTALTAGRLEAQTGDRLQLTFVEGGQRRQLTVRVAGITKLGGIGTFGSLPGVFVPAAAIQTVTGADTVNVVRISAKGDGQAEVDHSPALASAVRAAVASLPGGSQLVVREGKAADVAATQKNSNGLRTIFLALSLFVVVAGTMLVVNLTLALAEERRPRLAVLRALGLTRTGLVMAALLEGSIYGLAAGLVGILPGLAYSYAVLARPLPGDVAAASVGALSGASIFTVTPASVAISVCIGVLVTLATIVVVSVRTSRMAISSAIRDLPDPAIVRRRSWLRTTLSLGLVAAGGAAWLPGDPTLRILGGAALIVAAATLAPGQVSFWLRATLTGGAMVAWSLIWIAVGPSAHAQSAGNGIAVALAALGVSVFGAAVALSANLRIVELATRLVSARMVATLRPPLAHMTRRPVRSALATGTFALILSVLAFFAVVISSTGPDPTTVTGGYDVRVTSLASQALELPATLQSQVADQQSLKTLGYVGQMNLLANGTTATGWHSGYAQLYPLSDEQLSRPPLRLGIRDRHYQSDDAAWQAMRDDPSLVVSSGPGGAGLGQISFVGARGVRQFRIIGIVAAVVIGNQVSSGYLGSATSFDDLATTGSGTTILIKLISGSDARTFTRDLRRASFGQGVNAVAVADLVDSFNKGSAWFFGFFSLLLQTAVVVGVLTLGILALRAGIERRRTIGILRSLGYRPTEVLVGLLGEAVVTATIGIAVGVGLGLSVGWLAVHGEGNAFGRVDAGSILVPVVLIYAAVLLVTIGPAVRASRLPTSEALRIMA